MGTNVRTGGPAVDPVKDLCRARGPVENGPHECAPRSPGGRPEGRACRGGRGRCRRCAAAQGPSPLGGAERPSPGAGPAGPGGSRAAGRPPGDGRAGAVAPGARRRLGGRRLGELGCQLADGDAAAPGHRCRRGRAGQPGHPPRGHPRGDLPADAVGPPARLRHPGAGPARLSRAMPLPSGAQPPPPAPAHPGQQGPAAGGATRAAGPPAHPLMPRRCAASTARRPSGRPGR